MSWEDLRSCAQRTALNTFGVSKRVSWQPQGSSEPFLEVDGIFFEGWQNVQPETEARVDDRRPHCDFVLEDLGAEPFDGDRCRIPAEGGTLYEVVGCKPDGEGMTSLILHEVKE